VVDQTKSGAMRLGATGTVPANLKTVTDSAGIDSAQKLECDLCIIGAGSGGLSVASAAAQMGVKVILIEKHKMGGDCLNYGCVPSKALIAAARRAHTMRSCGPFGIRPVSPAVDPKGVHDHIKSVIAAIAPNDSVERFTGLGVQVIQAAARFISPDTVIAGDASIKARRFIIATGSAPAVPPIPGLDSVPYFTNETIFDNQSQIGHLIVIGGGPIGMEMAQAHRRLGSDVTVLEGMKALGKDDPELTAVALKSLRNEGLLIREGTRVEKVEGGLGRVRVHVSENGQAGVVDGTHILIAAGRKPNVSDLGLEAAGIKFDKRGIEVDSGLLTSNRHVFAIGDVTGGLQFTHVANYHAGIVILRALLRLPAKAKTDHVPWVTYLEPEIANVGLTEEAARKRMSKINVYRWPYHENDRAQAERSTEGLVKVVTDRSGKIVGAGIVGEHAGELIQMWSLAISQGMNIKAMTEWISPYPTLSEINKRVAFGMYAGKAANPGVRKILSFLRRFG
jgi:pyruvate/2-oxoglutarate dehydrogenase complex dihydrolipoamide dehydrogenase (E3) component